MSKTNYNDSQLTFYLTDTEGRQNRQIGCSHIDLLALRALKYYLRADEGEVHEKTLERIKTISRNIGTPAIGPGPEVAKLRGAVCRVIAMGVISVTAPSKKRPGEQETEPLTDKTLKHMEDFIANTLYNTWYSNII